MVRDFWRDASLGAVREREFLAAVGRRLTTADHRARMAEKLWAWSVVIDVWFGANHGFARHACCAVCQVGPVRNWSYTSHADNP